MEIINNANRFDVKRFEVDLGDQKDKWLKLFTMQNIPRNIQIDKKDSSRSTGSGGGSGRDPRKSLQVVKSSRSLLFRKHQF